MVTLSVKLRVELFYTLGLAKSLYSSCSVFCFEPNKTRTISALGMLFIMGSIDSFIHLEINTTCMESKNTASITIIG